ncbi:MAG: zinc ribbon domain-containing protein [Ignavibacteriae bacterium]|nr:MAG: zinc ribbon domain-containing protein [Ignavibacteriota bacterium]
MPVYDYRCEECHSTYDVFHKGREIQEDVVCPSCGSTNHKKLMSVPVVSMGSGSLSSKKSNASSCDSGSCCGGSCGLN